MIADPSPRFGLKLRGDWRAGKLRALRPAIKTLFPARWFPVVNTCLYQPVKNPPADSICPCHSVCFRGHYINRREPAGKPGSVVDSHSSGMHVTAHLKQPTREPCGPHDRSPIWSCSGWGFPCHVCCQTRGALLPHHFTLTGSEELRRYIFCGTFRRLTPPRYYLAPCPVEPGLSSPSA